MGFEVGAGDRHVQGKNANPPCTFQRSATRRVPGDKNQGALSMLKRHCPHTPGNKPDIVGFQEGRSRLGPQKSSISLILSPDNLQRSTRPPPRTPKEGPRAQVWIRIGRRSSTSPVDPSSCQKGTYGHPSAQHPFTGRKHEASGMTVRVALS